jgi:hypothetical protein
MYQCCKFQHVGGRCFCLNFSQIKATVAFGYTLSPPTERLPTCQTLIYQPLAMVWTRTDCAQIPHATNGLLLQQTFGTHSWLVATKLIAVDRMGKKYTAIFLIIPKWSATH